jgi:hypothetical protein
MDANLNIPRKLLQVEGNCGPVSIWLVLQQFGKCVPVDQIICESQHSTDEGTYTIALAVALQRFGLCASFHTEKDESPQPTEVKAYKTAQKLGLKIQPPLELKEIEEALRQKRAVIAFFDTADGTGHFSPIQSIIGGRVWFTYSNEPSLAIEEFEARRGVMGILRQSIVVWRPMDSQIA